jgi:hypothetical protein
MNKTYYGLATDAKGNSKVIDNLSDFRPTAEREMREHCKKNGLTYQDLRPTGNKERGGNVLTKFAKARKLVNGKLGHIKP